MKKPEFSKPAGLALDLTETPTGYVLSEDIQSSPGRLTSRFLGLSFVLAGVGLIAVPVGSVWVAKFVLSVLLVVAGALIAAQASAAPRAEIEVDLTHRVLRKRRRRGQKPPRLVAQIPFEVISGFEVDGEGTRAALFMETGARRRALLTGAPEALRFAARRVGLDLVRARQAEAIDRSAIAMGLAG